MVVTLYLSIRCRQSSALNGLHVTRRVVPVVALFSKPQRPEAQNKVLNVKNVSSQVSRLWEGENR